MEVSLCDQIAFAIAKEIGFECYKKVEGEYVLKKNDAGAMSPPLYGHSAGPNPCGEIPLGWYEVYLEIKGNIMTLNGAVRFDLNDPESLNKFKAEFQDLERLEQKISNRRQGHPDNGYEGSDEPGIFYKKHAKTRLDHYKNQTWAKCNPIPPGAKENK